MKFPSGERPKTVVIYQMGKVGSSSLRDSLTNVEGLEVIHAHHLYAPYATELNQQKQSMGWRLTQDPKKVRQLWSKVSDGRDLYVISAVREPLSRNISAYFQNLSDIFGAESAHLAMSQEELLAGFLNRYPHSIPLEWFDKEMRRSLGIDVYQYRFPHERGWARIKRGNYSLLLIRHDLNDSQKIQQVEKFLGVCSIVMTSTNIGKDKPYRYSYDRFIREVKFDRSFLDQMLNSKYARHFYSSEELRALNERWSFV